MFKYKSYGDYKLEDVVCVILRYILFNNINCNTKVYIKCVLDVADNMSPAVKRYILYCLTYLYTYSYILDIVSYNDIENYIEKYDVYYSDEILVPCVDYLHMFGVPIIDRIFNGVVTDNLIEKDYDTYINSTYDLISKHNKFSSVYNNKLKYVYDIVNI
jgi:hypothetical protein